MAISRMSLLDMIPKAGVKGDTDFLREGLKVLAEAIMKWLHKFEVFEEWRRRAWMGAPSIPGPR